MHSQDSVTCRSCHDANAIQPTSDDGRKAHELLRQGGVTCVDCHTNLVHPAAASAAPPSTEVEVSKLAANGRRMPAAYDVRSLT